MEDYQPVSRGPTPELETHPATAFEDEQKVAVPETDGIAKSMDTVHISSATGESGHHAPVSGSGIQDSDRITRQDISSGTGPTHQFSSSYNDKELEKELPDDIEPESRSARTGV